MGLKPLFVRRGGGVVGVGVGGLVESVCVGCVVGGRLEGPLLASQLGGGAATTITLGEAGEEARVGRGLGGGGLVSRGLVSRGLVSRLGGLGSLVCGYCRRSCRCCRLCST